jgi:hypothetical protein
MVDQRSKPKGHGLIDGRPLTEQERFVEYQRRGFMPPEGARFPNKRAVRIAVLIPSSDRNLYHWPKWGRKRLAPDWYERMDRIGGGKSKTWWVYFGQIPPTSFRRSRFSLNCPPDQLGQHEGRPKSR